MSSEEKSSGSQIDDQEERVAYLKKVSEHMKVCQKDLREEHDMLVTIVIDKDDEIDELKAELVRVKRAAAAERRENDQLKSLIMLRGFND
jgi:hypothetical protein